MYKVETIYTPGLAQNGYLIVSANEAVMIDPRRDTTEIHELLSKHNAKLKYIFETHSHADFVSGGPQLSAETGAPLLISDIVNPAVEHTPISHGQKFVFGNATITSLFTPGHTPEHMCYYLEEEGATPALFSGDLVFVGDLGRPELLGDELAKDLAPKLFNSVFETIAMLPPQTIVYPGHGAGSLCGKSLRDEPTSTLADEFATSPALQIRNKDDFIKYMMSDQPRVPSNFSRMAKLNRAGVSLLTPTKIKELNPEQIEQALSDEESLVIDIRPASDFSKAHIPNSIFLGLGDSVPTWLGWLFLPEQKFYLVADKREDAEQFAILMSRVGYDIVEGVLLNGVTKWVDSGRKTVSLSVASPLAASNADCLVDVRTPNEFQQSHLNNSESIPLCEIPTRFTELPKDKTITLMCAGGYRGTVAASLLMRSGIQNVENIEGGFCAVEESPN